MALAALDALRPLLACPRCRNAIAEQEGAWRCAGTACGKTYRSVGAAPVLVDFEDSILSEDELFASGGRGPFTRQFTPSRKARLYAALQPRNKAAGANAARLKSLLAGEAPLLLVIGGGSAGDGTGALYGDPSLRIVAFDVYASPLTQFIADAHRIPLADESVDGVWVQAVLEHVLDPWAVAAEIHRVLKPDGALYAETPFLQQVHEGPHDFTRFTESGQRWLFRRFEAVDSGVALGPASPLLWSIEHGVRGLSRSVKLGRLARAAFCWLRVLDRLVPRRFAVDGASAVYFLGRKSETALKPRDMVAHYQGAYLRKH